VETFINKKRSTEEEEEEEEAEEKKNVLKSVENIEIFLQSDKNIGHLVHTKTW